MDKRAKIIILADEKVARDFINQRILKKTFRRKILEKRAEIISEELDDILMDLHSLSEKEDD